MMRQRWSWIGMAVAVLVAACSSKPTTEVPAGEKVEPVVAEAVKIEVWHDTICPWCRIGLHNLESVIAGWNGPPIEVVHRAYVFSPDLPPEGVDMRESLATRMSPEQIDAMFARAAQAGAAVGLHFDFEKVRVSPLTIPSHVLVDWAPSSKRGAIVAAVHRAHFEEGRNIGDLDVLTGIAAAAGLDRDEARAALEDPARIARIREEAASARQAGVRGVPHFVIGGRTLQGAQSTEALRQAITAAAQQAR